LTPIIGTIASSYLSGTVYSAINAFDSIATISVGSGGTQTVEFTSIPNTYSHLQIRGIWKVNNTNGGSPRILFNNDTTNSYNTHATAGDGSTTSNSNTTNNGEAYLGFGNQSTSQFTSMVIDIFDYANTNKYKTARTLIGVDLNGSGNAQLVGISWMSFNAISSIKIFPQSNTTPTNTFLQYSEFSLYGIKTA
jgi:hypothetical protein